MTSSEETILLEYVDTFDNNEKKTLLFSKHLIEQDFNEKSLFAILIDGKSMEPNITDKSVLIADLSQKNLIDKKIYLLYYASQLWVKQYSSKQKQFISINPQFSHLVYDEQNVHLVARVLLTFKNL